MSRERMVNAPETAIAPRGEPAALAKAWGQPAGQAVVSMILPPR